MTLDWIKANLKINGKNTKSKVLQALENASDSELIELQKSIDLELISRRHKKLEGEQ